MIFRRLRRIEHMQLWMENRIEAIYRKVIIDGSTEELRKMVASEFAELKELIRHSASVQASAVVLLKSLADKLNGLADHPSAEDIRQMSDELRQHAQELGEAIAMHAPSGAHGGPQPGPEVDKSPVPDDDEPIPGEDAGDI